MQQNLLRPGIAPQSPRSIVIASLAVTQIQTVTTRFENCDMQQKFEIVVILPDAALSSTRVSKQPKKGQKK